MTEKILLQENPFIFEQDKKLFIQQLEKLHEEREYLDDQEEQQTKERLMQQPTKCGIIRALDEEAEKIAKAREEVLQKDIQLGKGKGMTAAKNMRLWDVSDYEPKTGIYKVKKLLKERKETVGDFIQKNRQTFLTNLNITNKKEETNKLEDFIKNEQENLKAMYQYFVKDNQLVQKFMSDVKAAAEKAAKEAEIEAKKKEELKTQINKHLVQKDQCENKNERLRDEIEQLQNYQKFIELTRKNMDAMISEKKKKDKSQKKLGKQKQDKLKSLNVSNQEDPAFITQQPGENQNQMSDSNIKFSMQESGMRKSKLSSFNHINNIDDEEEFDKYRAIDFKPIDLMEYLYSIEEKNLTYIHDKYEAEDELTIYKTKLKELQNKKQQQEFQNYNKKRELEKQKKQQFARYRELTEAQKINTDKVKFTEGPELRFEEIRNKIEQIYSIIQPNKKSENKLNQTYNQVNLGNTANLNMTIKENIEQVKEINSQEMKKKMLEIELKIYELTKECNSMEEFSPTIFKQVTQYVKQKHHKEKQKADDELKEIQEKHKFKLREEARSMALQKRRKGRIIMEKSIVKKKQQKEEKVEIQDDSNEDEKYLQENFELGQDIKLKQ